MSRSKARGNTEKWSCHTLPFYDDSFRHAAFDSDSSLEFAEGAFLEEIDKFDYRYFKISPTEARVMDPTQRIFLECAMSCVEHAGYGGDALKSTRTGVFVGTMPDFRPFNYKDLILKFPNVPIDLYIAPNLMSVVPSRLAYFLDLKGPAMFVDTSCSSSLLAVHLACQSLAQEECDQAVAGGIKLNLAPFAGLARPVIESPSGHSRVFDNRADGIGIGEGAVAVFLKPLDAARRDGDFVWAVIRGRAINQDGRTAGMACADSSAARPVGSFCVPHRRLQSSSRGKRFARETVVSRRLPAAAKFLAGTSDPPDVFGLAAKAGLNAAFSMTRFGAPIACL